MRRTQNYGLPIIESEDRYSKEEQNNAMDIIDGELHGLSQSFKNVINDVNTSIESVVNDVNTSINDVNTSIESVVNNVNTSIESAINDVNTSIESVKEFENKIQEDYDSLKRIIIDENASAKLQNQINTINDDLQNHINTVNTDFQNQINAVNTGLQNQINTINTDLENTNMEVRLARGTHNTLNDRLCEVDERQDSISSQLEEINELKNIVNTKATKDGTLQIGLNAEKVGGSTLEEIYNNILTEACGFELLPTIGSDGGSYTNVPIKNYIEITFRGKNNFEIKFNDTSILRDDSGSSYRRVGTIKIFKNGMCYVANSRLYQSSSSPMEAYDVADAIYHNTSGGEKVTVTVKELNTITITGTSIYNEVKIWN